MEFSEFNKKNDQSQVKVYTKAGDKGMSSLMNASHIAKSDERFELLGTIDELTSHIGEVKANTTCPVFTGWLERIQNNLMTIMAGVADNRNRTYFLDPKELEELEAEIDRLEHAFPREKKFILPGGCKQSARIDVTRTVARRAERRMVACHRKYGVHPEAMRYMNRLADYFYIAARYKDYEVSQGKGDEISSPTITSDAVVTEVLRRMGALDSITLDMAKELIERIEAKAKAENKPSVIAICNPQGNPVAVHCMDGAFLVSFDVATKKAYTSVAVKMSTMELSKLAQPGGTFYGLDKLDEGKMVIFGGGIPLKIGDKIIGGLGVSGGTGEEDHELAEYGIQMLGEMLSK